MNIQSYNDLKNSIKTKDIKPVYFLCGNEPYLIDFIADKIAKTVVTALPEINFRTFSTDFDVSEIYSISYAVPMMSEKKCIILNDFNLAQFKENENDFKQLISLVSEPSDLSVIIFKYTGIDISFDNSYKYKSQSKNYRKIATAIEKAGGTIAKIDKLTIGETVRTVMSGAKKRHCIIEPSTAQYLITNYTDSLSSLLTEVEKMCSYIKEGYITKELIDKLCTPSIEAVIFNMSKAVMACNVKSAISILNNLQSRKTDASDIIWELSNTFINIYRMKSADSSGVPLTDVAKDFGIGETRLFVLRDASKKAKSLTVNQIFTCLKLLSVADADVRGASKMKEYDTLKILIINLIIVISGGKVYDTN